MEEEGQRTWFKKGDKPASKPAPAIAKCSADVDEFGWPKAPIEGGEVTEEQVERVERMREEILASKTPNKFPEPFKKQGVPLTSHMTQEEFEELDYPKVPPEWNEEWMREQIEKETVDPRENANLLYDEAQQEFWFNASRKPYAKAILRSEQHWTSRRNVWLNQYATVETMNQLREAVSEELEDCSMEVKRLLTPIMHHRITEMALKTYVREAKEHQVPLAKLLEQPDKLKELQSIRQQIDHGGDECAAELMEKYNATMTSCLEGKAKEKREAERGKRVEADTDTVAKVLNMGEKCKRDGYLEWNKGNWEEALASWRLGDTYLKRFKLPEDDKNGNQLIANLHLPILKNLAQAAIKMGWWTEALEAAEDALRIDNQDHKAWFRKACALEGLGRYEEEAAALDKVDDISVGRPDQARIQKDLQAKRSKLKALDDETKEVQRRGVARAVTRGVFSTEREPEALPDAAAAQALEPAPADTPSCPFKAGDAVVVRRAIADLERGLRGTVVEVDGDGDARIQFEGHEDIEMLLGEDLGCLALDTGEELSPEEEDDDARQEDPAPEALADKPAPAQAPRKRLTKDSAADLLEELRIAYEDTVFRRQVLKLARDVRWDKAQFVANLRRVALDLQRPILEKWGFEATPQGLAEVELALQDHTRGEGMDAALKEKSDMVTRLLYGEMYGVVFLGSKGGGLPPAIPASSA